MRARTVGGAGAIALVALTIAGVGGGLGPKVLGIAWVAFVAMVAGAWLGRVETRERHANRLVWGYGLASGAMITSAAAFLVPGAIDHHPAWGGFGIAAGVLLGYSAHTVGHRLTHVNAALDDTTLRLTVHALSAGAIIGLVYAAMPALGPLLGLAIVSHKGPAGYAAARRIAAADRPISPLLLPAAGVGITAIPAALLAVPPNSAVNGVVFGFAAGVFLHLAMDFLPRCEVGGEVYEAAMGEEHSHALLDHLRLHAVASTAVGGAAVFLAWVALGGAI